VIEQERRIRALLPSASLHLGRSACGPGLDPGDLDLRVDDGAGAAEILRSTDPVLYPEEYRALKATPENHERRTRAFFERMVAEL
jgi:hypothetical protein